MKTSNYCLNPTAGADRFGRSQTPSGVRSGLGMRWPASNRPIAG